MKTLRPDELMAVEPGGLAEEAERHRRFAALRVTVANEREWYRPDVALTSHIAQVADTYRAPALPPFGPLRGPINRHGGRGDANTLTRSLLNDLHTAGVRWADVLWAINYMRANPDLAGASPADLHRMLAVFLNGKLVGAVAVAELNRRGEKFADIGRRYGVSESTASRWVQPPKRRATTMVVQNEGING